MALFGKKQTADSNDIPVDQVSTMKAQGYDNNQVVQALQRDGYTSSQIFEAMNRVDLQPLETPPAQQEMAAPQEDYYQDQGFPEAMPQQQDFAQPRPYPEQAPPQVASVQTEELVEAIIDEKWNELVKDINKIVEWKNKTEAKIATMEQKFEDLKDSFDKLHQAVIGKVGEYDQNILSVGAEVKAMEKVFSKVLPVFTENVNELSRVTDIMRKKK
jgi:uncharacterized protein YoxC